MKRIISMLAVALLAAASSQSQEPKKSVLIVETGKPTPTVVKTGDLVTVNYRVRWYDLAQMGQNGEVRIFEEDMKPENLPVDPFEAVSLDIGSLGKDGNEFYKDFTYTFRIIGRDKSSEELKHAIPSFRFLWSIKKAGETDESDQELLEFETDPIPITYVSTIGKDDELYIRDEFYFPDYQSKSLFLRILPVVMVLGATIMLVSGLAAPKIQTLMKKNKATGADPNKPNVVVARMKLYKLLNKLEAGEKPYMSHRQEPKQELIAKDLYGACQDMILAELPEVNRSYTARDISRYITDNLPPGEVKRSLGAIARQMRIYTKIMDGIRGDELQNRDAVIGEAKNLRNYANQLVWYKKLWFRLATWKR